MHILRKLFYFNKNRAISRLFLPITVSALLTLLTVISVHAGSGSGSGGEASACGSSSVCSTNGHGWYDYPVDGSIKPLKIQNQATTGINWNNVLNTCQSVGADRVMAFIVIKSYSDGTADRTDATMGYVYDYENWGFTTGNNDKTNIPENDGVHGWLHDSQARSYYGLAELNPSSWGNSIGWFCYKWTWTISTTTAVNKLTASPGVTATWTHTVKNDGDDQLNTKVNYGYVTQIKSPSGAVISTDWSNAANIGSLAVNTKKNGAASFTSNFTVTDQPDGTQICRSTVANPSKRGGSDNTALNYKCVTVVDNAVWSLTPNTQIRTKPKDGDWTGWQNGKNKSSPADIYVDDSYQWNHIVSNVGDKTNYLISYYYKVDGDATDYKISDISAASGLAGGASVSQTSWAFTPSATGTYCRKTWASSTSSALKTTAIASDWSCVRVKKRPWALNVDTKIQKTTNSTPGGYQDISITAKPGEAINWNHIITNGGPNSTDSNFNWYYVNDATMKAKTGNPTGVNHVKAFPFKITDKVELASYLSGTNQFIIGQDDVGVDIYNGVPGYTGYTNGDGYCRSTYVNNISESGGDIDADKLCVTVPYDYTLDPQITLDSVGGAVPGQTITVKPYVDNSGATKSLPTNWLVNIYKNTDKIGEIIYDASVDKSDIVFNTGTKYLANGSYVIPDTFMPNDKICFGLEISRRSSADSNSAESGRICVLIGKKPKVQVWGGDLWSGGKVQTSTSVIAGNTYGSWSEYSIFSNSLINSMASGSVFAGLGNPSICGYSKLSFTNEDCAASPPFVGQYAYTRSAPNISASFPTDLLTPLVPDGASVYDLSGSLYKGSGTISIHGREDEFDTRALTGSIVINAPEANATITSDINYQDNQSGGIADIPQLVIIAKNINVTGDVTNIDAWLIAKDGIINTCSDRPLDQIRIADSCSKKLVINGPVVAKQLYLYRTFGSEIGSFNQPAEIINFRADALLWAAAQSNSSTAVKTVYTIEQPPRF